jgi:pseudaminic acid synthase
MNSIKIANRVVGQNTPTYIVAEMSANHNQDFNRAVKIIEAAKESGADAIKLQTYTGDTLSLKCDNEYFRINGTIWNGQNLHELYEAAHTPWDWQPKLQKIAQDLGLDLFSSPFDPSSIDFLSKMDIPVYKVASPELIDLPLLGQIAKVGKPIILSTGMATLGEIDIALRTIYAAGNTQVALLKCTSAYPALPEEMNLQSIPHLATTFKTPVGLSDHTLGSEVAIAAVALGASIIEKHLTLSRQDGGPDSAFSQEPDEFKEMVRAVRVTEKAIGSIKFGPTKQEEIGQKYRRSLFVVQDIKEGDVFTVEKVRSIRPGHGLPPVFIKDVIGRKARTNLKKGTPVSWDAII